MDSHTARHELTIMHLRSALRRCRTVLGNMAAENTGLKAVFWRWPINHEPLRNDARNLLPEIDQALADAGQTGAKE